MIKELKKKFTNMSGTQLLAVGFFTLIMIGTILLMLPVSARDGKPTSFITALFTSTSAGCVTGLTLTDTYDHWSTFGHVVLLILIQIGGLGFISIGAAITMIMRRRIGLRQRGWIRESLNVLDIGGIVDLLRVVLKGTAIVEGMGAAILAIRFYPIMGLNDAVWYGIFHSVSAFCNGGFDLMGKYGMSSFCGFTDDTVVVVTTCAIILIGGLGFLVWQDLKEKKLKFSKYMLQTKIVLAASAILVVGGTVLFYFIEKDYTFAGMTTKQRFLSALFCAVTPRTAGFNIVEYGEMSSGGKFLSILLMFVGGGSGSTAGGLKMATLFVLVAHLNSTLTRSTGTNVFGRRIDDSTTLKATSLFNIYMCLIVASTLIICSIEGTDLGDTLFEVVSACCTVGVTAGLTRQLNLISQIILIILMYLGRLGSLSFALSFTDHKKIAHVMQPVEQINIG